MGAFPPTAAGEERHTRVLTPVHECVWDVSPGSAAAEGQPVGGGRAHEDRCCFRAHCPELSYHRLLPSRPSPFPSLPIPEQRAVGWERVRNMRLLCVTGNREGTAWELRGCAAGPGPLLSRLPSAACLAGAVSHSCSSSLTSHRASQAPWDRASKCTGGPWAGHCTSFPWPSTSNTCLADSMGEELEQLSHN